jgi:hypothetical protein
MTIAKARLLKQLEASYTNTVRALYGLDWDTIIHADSGWTIKDLVWHIAVWENEMLQTLRGVVTGHPHHIEGYDMNDDDSFNARMRAARVHDSAEQIERDWHTIRLQFMHALAAVPLAALDYEALFPWTNKPLPLHTLITEALEHEAEHLREILAVCKPD